MTIEENLLEQTKIYAQKQHISISELVEGYFKNLTKTPKQKNIVDLVEQLAPSNIDPNADLKELYYQNQSKKYGI